jgi:hypothetical protein
LRLIRRGSLYGGSAVEIRGEGCARCPYIPVWVRWRFECRWRAVGIRGIDAFVALTALRLREWFLWCMRTTKERVIER